jgi:hypothetical protein
MPKKIYIPISSIISLVRAIRRARKLYKKIKKQKLKEGHIMAKFELGITVGEITAMLPNVLSQAWAAYSDDKKISVDEGLDIVVVILSEMAEAADQEEVEVLFLSLADAIAAVKPFTQE